jgi:hypothetical protein
MEAQAAAAPELQINVKGASMKNPLVPVLILAIAAPATAFIGDRPPSDPAPVAPAASPEEQLAANGVVESSAPAPFHRTESTTIREDSAANQDKARQAIQGFLVNNPNAAQSIKTASAPAAPAMPQWLVGTLIAAGLLGALTVGVRWYADKHAPKMPEFRPSKIDKI